MKKLVYALPLLLTLQIFAAANKGKFGYQMNYNFIENEEKLLMKENLATVAEKLGCKKSSANSTIHDGHLETRYRLDCPDVLRIGYNVDAFPNKKSVKRIYTVYYHNKDKVADFHFIKKDLVKMRVGRRAEILPER